MTVRQTDGLFVSLHLLHIHVDLTHTSIRNSRPLFTANPSKLFQITWSSHTTPLQISLNKTLQLHSNGNQSLLLQCYLICKVSLTYKIQLLYDVTPCPWASSSQHFEETQGFDCHTLKKKALQTFKMSAPSRQTTQSHFPENLITQHHYCEEVKSCILSCVAWSMEFLFFFHRSKQNTVS